MNHNRFSREFPLSRLLTQCVEGHTDGCLCISGGLVSWFIYLKQGKLIYASNSIDPFGRFDRYLRRLSVQVPTLVSAIRIQARLMFEAPTQEMAASTCRDYQAVSWLVEQRHLNPAQAAILIEEIAKEVLESLLSVPEGDCKLIPFEQDPDSFCHFDLPSLMQFCQSRLRQRQAAGLTAQPRTTALNTTSSYSLSALAQQSSARSIAVTLEPSPLASLSVNQVGNQVGNQAVNPPANSPRGNAPYKIACIDDSPTILKSINAYLNDENVAVIMINDPVKALMQVIRSKPDLILLDVTMPNLDGYELCSLLRKHPSFRRTPVIMVTSNSGFIDRAKAKLVGASGYLTKPFTQPDLVKMVFKHLS
ncbi:MAG: response regulator [Pegethrix bostrychoides GSE-TBD4-15B]|jgi:twitching motility two-component system response regulator PilG|uniref:Response regulator n=1 Tax=Pegethrix bostrychoides GSE-TBD4-15B TaxID=2839662 RepID=A0A951PAB3_9CYAN|nr:response regulator [Pegethrix bostrychoides GSE-TBD4-15B]